MGRRPHFRVKLLCVGLGASRALPMSSYSFKSSGTEVFTHASSALSLSLTKLLYRAHQVSHHLVPKTQSAGIVLNI